MVNSICILCAWILIDFEKAITFCFSFSFFSTTVGIVEIFSVMSVQTIKCHFRLQPSQYVFVMTVKHFCYRDILLLLSDLWKIRGHHDVITNTASIGCEFHYIFSWDTVEKRLKIEHDKQSQKLTTNLFLISSFYKYV